MGTHWFFSLGTNPREAVYRDGAAPGVPRYASADWVLPALIELRSLAEPGSLGDVELHYLGTEDCDTQPFSRAVSQRWPALEPALKRGLGDARLTLERRDARSIWQVVDRVLSRVHDGDVVLIEATAGIATIRYGLLLAAGLLRVLRPGARLEAVTYAELGAGEPVERDASGRWVASPNGAERASPIYDVAELLDAFDWANAVGVLQHSLDPTPLAALARKANGRAQQAAQLSGLRIDTAGAKLVGLLDGLGHSLALADSLAFGEKVRKLPADVTAFLEALRAHGYPAASHALDHAAAVFGELGRHVPASRDVFDRGRLAFELDLVDALVEAHRFADALRVLREWFVNAHIEANGAGRDWRSRDLRVAALDWLRAQEHGRTDLGTQWASVRMARNRVSHPGYATDAEDQKESTVMGRAREVSRFLRGALWPDGGPGTPADMALERFVATRTERGRGLFVNWSNHPQATWQDAQRDAALVLGDRIVDLPFPAVDADLEEIDALAGEALEALPSGVTHAMVQGEYAVTFALVQALQRRGIVCLTATTDRDVQPGPDGTKVSKFRFVRFRPYPTLATPAKGG